MALPIVVTHGGGKKIDAEVAGFTVRTDQDVKGGGDGSAPEPYMLFLASLATCSGIYVVGFCQARNIPTDGIRVVQDHDFDPKRGGLYRVRQRVEVPPDFPEKYRTAVRRAASACAVKKTIDRGLELEVETVVTDAA